MTPIHSRLLKIMLPLAAVAGFAATPALAEIEKPVAQLA